MSGQSPESESPSAMGVGLIRAIKIALAVFAVLIGVIGVIVWMSGDPETVPFDYEGFD